MDQKLNTTPNALHEKIEPNRLKLVSLPKQRDMTQLNANYMVENGDLLRLSSPNIFYRLMIVTTPMGPDHQRSLQVINKVDRRVGREWKQISKVLFRSDSKSASDPKIPWCNFPERKEAVLYKDMGQILSRFPDNTTRLIAQTGLQIMRGENDKVVKSLKQLSTHKETRWQELSISPKAMLGLMIGAAACEVQRGCIGYVSWYAALDRVAEYKEKYLNDYVRKVFFSINGYKSDSTCTIGLSFFGSETTLRDFSVSRTLDERRYSDKDPYVKSLGRDLDYLASKENNAELEVTRRYMLYALTGKFAQAVDLEEVETTETSAENSNSSSSSASDTFSSSFTITLPAFASSNSGTSNKTQEKKSERELNENNTSSSLKSRPENQGSSSYVSIQSELKAKKLVSEKKSTKAKKRKAKKRAKKASQDPEKQISSQSTSSSGVNSSVPEELSHTSLKSEMTTLSFSVNPSFTTKNTELNEEPNEEPKEEQNEGLLNKTSCLIT